MTFLYKNFYRIMGICGLILLWLQESKVPVAIVLIAMMLNEFLIDLLKDKIPKRKGIKK